MSQNSTEKKKLSNNISTEGGLRLKNIFKKDLPNKPLITIITATFNSEKYLEESILSLHKQKYDNYEHIIIDGGSSDETLNILKKYENKIDYWCSAKDKGIYDAFNIGMRLSAGSYLGFLNSDDTYTDNAFELLMKYIKNYPEKDFIFGAVKKHWGVLYGYKPYKIYWSWGFYSSHSTGFFIKSDSAKKVGVPVSVCGEMAGDTMFTSLLLGMGIKSLSMSISRILKVKQFITKIDSKEVFKICNEIFREHDNLLIKRKLKVYYDQIYDELNKA
mgnify:CR=1 FL=1